MTSRTYAMYEFIGTSPDGIDAAVRNAVARANKSIPHIDWFEVVQVRGYVLRGGIDHFQVTVKIGARLEDA